MTLLRAIGLAFLVALASGCLGSYLHAQWKLGGRYSAAGAVFAWQVFFIAGLVTFAACWIRGSAGVALGLTAGVMAALVGLNGTALPFESAARTIIGYDGPIFPGGDDEDLPPVLVAVGDSYSSGEGNPPFDRGTRRGCRRSSASWTRTLEVVTEGSVDIRHVACSGSVIDNVRRTGLAGEPGQVGQLERIAANREVRAVTVSVGGNDAYFAVVADACFRITRSCNPETPVMQRARAKVAESTFRSELTDLYTALALAADGAPVFVMDYPLAFVPGQQNRRACSAGQGLEGILRASPSEQEAVIAFQQELNDAVRDAVDAAGDNVHLIEVADTFNEGPLCGDNTLFVPLDFGTEDNPFDPKNAFHPNRRGQEALRQRADAVIASVL